MSKAYATENAILRQKLVKIEDSMDVLLEEMGKYFDYQLNGSQARRAIKKALKEKRSMSSTNKG